MYWDRNGVTNANVTLMEYKESRKDATELSFGNFSLFLTPSIFQKFHSANKFVCALTSNL